MPERSGNDFSCLPVQDVADRIRHNQRADHDVTKPKAGSGEAGLHSVVTLAPKHFPHGRSRTDTHVAFLKLACGGRLASLEEGNVGVGAGATVGKMLRSK